MRFLVYGTAESSPNVNPTHAKSNALKTWKKQISHFMPNKLVKWDAMLNVGNPTKSIKVNDVHDSENDEEGSEKGRKSLNSPMTCHPSRVQGSPEYLDE